MSVRLWLYSSRPDYLGPKVVVLPIPNGEVVLEVQGQVQSRSPSSLACQMVEVGNWMRNRAQKKRHTQEATRRVVKTIGDSTTPNSERASVRRLEARAEQVSNREEGEERKKVVLVPCLKAG